MNHWLKKNWALLLLILVVGLWAKSYFFGRQLFSVKPSSSLLMESYAPTLDSAGFNGKSSVGIMPSRLDNAPPQNDTTDRLDIRDTSLSLVVKDVSVVITRITDISKSLNGYLVSSNLSKPESAASGTITIRIPEDKLTEALNQFRGLSVKVVSESVNGHDVTDQYVDLDARLAILNQTKTKYQEILDRSVQINDLLNVQRELINLQSQIDQIVGQQKYLQQSAKLSRITVYLSTDELALPYAPDNVWRPAVVFKTAVRALIASMRDIGSAAIWLVVYTPFWLPLLLGLIYLKRRRLFFFAPTN